MIFFFKTKVETEMKQTGESGKGQKYRERIDHVTCTCGPWLAFTACVLSAGSCLVTAHLAQQVRILQQEIVQLNALNQHPSTVFALRKTQDKYKFPTNEGLQESSDPDTHSGQTNKGEITNLSKKNFLRAKRESDKAEKACLKGEKGSRGRKGKKGKRGKPGKKGPKGEKGEPGDGAGDSNVESALNTGHNIENVIEDYFHIRFTSNFWEDVTSNGFKSGCKPWESGLVCRNRTYTTERVPYLLPFLTHRSKQKARELPISQVESGQYRVYQSGTYLVYLHVAIWKRSESDVFAVVLERGEAGRPSTIFECRPVNDAWVENHYNTIFSTCVSTRTLYITKDDKISVYLLTAGTVIDLTEGETYFGVIKLS